MSSNVSNTPFKIWVVADFSSGLAENSHSNALNVNKANLSEVLASFNLQLVLTLQDFVPYSHTDSLVNIPVKRINDFSPEQIANNIELLQPYLKVSQLIQQCLDNAIDENTLREKLAEYISVPVLGKNIDTLYYELDSQVNASVPQKSADDDSVDRLLGMLDLGESSEDTSEPAVDSGSRATLQHSLNEIKRPLFVRLNNILHHQQFQALEAAWRGLAFLLMEDSKNIEVSIVDSNKTQASYHIHECLEATADEALPNLVIYNYQLDCIDADLKLLEDLTLIADALQVQSVINLSNNFFGVHAASELNGLTSLAPIFAKTPFVKWNSLRTRPSARWMACSFNQVLLRQVFSHHNNMLGFNERVQASEDLLFGNASWFLARLIAKSVNDTGWPCQLTPPTAPVISTLPMHLSEMGLNKTAQLSLESYVDETLAEQLVEEGVIVLQCRENQDTAFVKQLPLFFKLPKYRDELANLKAQSQNTLEFQLLSGWVVSVILVNRASFMMSGDVEQVKQHLFNLLANMLQDSGEGATVNLDIAKDASDPGHYLAKITLQFGRQVLNGVLLNFQLSL